MKQILLLPLIFALSVSCLWAQQSAPVGPGPGEVDTTWRGIRYQIAEIDRIPGNRLVFAVMLHATPQAPISTFIGIQPVIPPGTPARMLVKYAPQPISIASAVMTDEATMQTYQTLNPIPGGPNYIGADLLTTLHPNSSSVMTIQFLSPPPPQPVNGIIPKQTVSIFLPNARGPITHVVIPPPTPPAASTAKH